MNYLKNYSEIIGNSKKLDNFEQMTAQLLNNYVKNNFDKITALGFGSKITLCSRVKKIVDSLSSQNKINPDFLPDLIILFSHNLSEFNYLKSYVSLDHPKVLAHVHQLVEKLPYIDENFDLVTYVTEAKKNGFSEQQIQQDISIFIDKIMQAKKTVSVYALLQVMNSVSFQGKNVRKKLTDLLHCTCINSLKDLVDVLNTLKTSQSHVKKQQLSDILTLLSQNLLAQCLNKSDFYIVPACDSLQCFITAVEQLSSLKLSDAYKRNMLTLIKMAPDNENGLYFIERIRKLNSKLGFDIDLPLNTHASAAAIPDKENIPNDPNLSLRHSFFKPDNTMPQSKKQSNETKLEKSLPNQSLKQTNK